MRTLDELILERSNASISIFDIDDTLAFSNSQIRYKEPGDEWKTVGTEEFGNIRDGIDKAAEYDFSDFRDGKRIMIALKTAKPNIEILKKLDDAIARGDKIGVLTARGNKFATTQGVKNFLLYKNKNGDLVDIPKNQFNDKYIFAVGDSKTKAMIAKARGSSGGGSADPSEDKAYILQSMFADKMGFNNITFYDDDEQNIKAVDALMDPRIVTIKV